MHLRHAGGGSVLRSITRPIFRRYKWLQRLSWATSLVTLFWLYVLWKGERAGFATHIHHCQWEKWEQWPESAVPHHLVFIADPQLVDPHTYPGRPWPLSRLTEAYTDRYMARNFRLINRLLDPDSIVFLGDLFDGGREWATDQAKPLRAPGRQHLIKLGVLSEARKEGERMHPDGKTDLHKYIPGENGRWKRYNMYQWNKDYDRFSRIFFDHDQLFPATPERLLEPMYEEPPHPVSVANGASNHSGQHYGTNGRSRQVMASLPGNHDLGIGSGVQVIVRDRFESRFGEANTVYVLGNHTFVSLDVLSLSAFDEYVADVGEVSEERRQHFAHVWKPASDFLDELDMTGPRVIKDAMRHYFPHSHAQQTYPHVVQDPRDGTNRVAKQTASKPKLPVILLSHVPFFRNPDVDCGNQRERGKAIPLSAGYQYQNVLVPKLSSAIAKKVSRIGDMTHIFSGDDHDYCDVTHRFNVGRWHEETNKESIIMRTVREITVKSFSWAMGVRKPGFQLVSLWNPVDEMGNTIGTPLPTIQSHLCLLPDQLEIFLNYATLLSWTFVLLVGRAVFLGLRARPDSDDNDSEEDGVPKLTLPKYTPRSKSPLVSNGRVNGHVSPSKNGFGGRQRASSTSTSHTSGNNNLGVQRSMNARTRSVSPAVANGYALPNLYENDDRPLVDKAGYYPQMRWQDPDESDEESHTGDFDEDSQGKGAKKTNKSRSRARRMLDEFVTSLVLVGVPTGLFYGWLITNG